MSKNEAREFAEGVLRNLTGMLMEVTRDRDGVPRTMNDRVAVGVLNAQSNMAIAAALMLVAAEIEDQA